MEINKYNSLVLFQSLKTSEKTLAFLFTVAYAILVYLAYKNNSFGWLFVLSVLYLESGFVFLVARNNVVLNLPDVATYNLYQAGDNFFVGGSQDEADLFFEILDEKEESKLVKSNVYFFDK